jgi:hypothetical protein
MRYCISKSLVVLLVLGLLQITDSCKKHEVPSVTTAEVINITGNSATSGGTITDEGSCTVVERGICWSKVITPETTDKLIVDEGVAATFISNLDNLDFGTSYKVRAYAKNEEGIGYGMPISFSTLGQTPSATTESPCCLEATGAKLIGTVNANYGSTTVTFEYGITTTYGNYIEAIPGTVTGNNPTSVIAGISRLNPETSYHFRVKAVNALGTQYGNDVEFTTLPKSHALPIITTNTINNIDNSTASSGGDVSSDGGSFVTARGVCWSTIQNSTVMDYHTFDGSGLGSFASILTDLQSGTKYYVRAYATNISGTSYGNEYSFTTSLTDPPIGGQIIADHTIVDRFDDIPQQYIDLVKRMWVTIPGESHYEAYRVGCRLLEELFPEYQVNITRSGNPEGYTDQYLRISSATWGDLNNTSGWIYEYGEEDWWTSTAAIARTKAGLSYCNETGLPVSAIGFAWCSDMAYGDISSSVVDAVYGCHWWGASKGSPSGNRCWGLDNEDNTITGNNVNLDTYLDATQQYVNYCIENSIPTKVFFTTGTVDNTHSSYTVERGYQAYLKMEHIRNYVKADATRILFDYADILTHDDNGSLTTSTWNGKLFPSITATNLGDSSIGHIGSDGAIRLAKAMWWMLARISGWDGN